MNQTKTAKRKNQNTPFSRHRSIPIPSPLRTAADINRTPPFGGRLLLLGPAREKPLETVCNLIDYGLDGSLITVWEEWTELAITSSEGSGRARLVRFGGYFTQLIAAWLHLYVRITPEELCPSLILPKSIPVKHRLSVENEPETMIRSFTRLCTRQESLEELWAVTDAVSPAARQEIRRNLLSYYEALACITEASTALFPSPENRAGKGL